MRKYNNGFTLIELIIAVAVMGILVAFALPAYDNYIEKADLADATSTLIMINQDVAQQKLSLFNSNIQKTNIDEAIKNHVGKNTNVDRKYTIAGVCDSTDNCSDFHLYAEPKGGINLKKSIWMSSDSSTYICDNKDISNISDPSGSPECKKQ